MSKVYLLPCACGEKLRIDASQAGLDLRCRCGQTVKAPTFRELSRLEQVEEEPATRPHADWGARQRLLLIGGMITACGLAIAAGFWCMTPPSDPPVTIDPRFIQAIDAEVGAMKADKLIEAWEQMATQELDRSELPIVEAHRREVKRMRGFTYAGLALVAAGAMVLASSLFVGKPTPRQTNRQPGGRSSR
ncbi:MAG TPA: hypothetical protein VGJ26_00870 [Pirellulales bacterium]|jgi:hypothetical protein